MTPKRSVRAGCAGMVAAASLFALLFPAPAGGPEGLMGLGDQLGWLAALLLVSIIAFAPIASLFARWSRITPPALDGELQSGQWQGHTSKAYIAGATGALLGAAVFGLTAFAMVALLGMFVELPRNTALILSIGVGSVAGLRGAVWAGRRALWSVTIDASERRHP